MQIKKTIYHPIKNSLAKNYLKFLVSRGCDVIGITGSAGKTTTKEMIASVLSQKYKTNWTRANIDPVYNIPSTILKTPRGTKKLVLEMGIEYLGEMESYVKLAPPKIGVFTNVYWTHTEFLVDIETVAKEKSQLIAALPKNGYAVLNADDARVVKSATKTKAKILWFSIKTKADVMAKDISLTKDYQTSFVLQIGTETIKVTLPLLGKHFVSLALSAAAVGVACGLKISEIKKGLENMRPQPHRMRASQSGGRTIIDDTYNANPLATIEALKTLEELGKNKRKIFVLGEMKELGTYKEKGHRQVGEFAKSVGVEYFLSLGNLTQFSLDEFVKSGGKKDKTFLAPDKNVLVKKIKEITKKGDTILIKGSRSMAMEEILEKI